MGWGSKKSHAPDQIDNEIRVIQKNHDLENDLKESIEKRDFENAAKVQKEIDILRAGKEKIRVVIFLSKKIF